jgi:glycosyltransferase involved in cell wall biosynthesis
MSQQITVVIPTRNRCEVLKTTLADMARVRRGSLAVEFVVVDNGSVDGTQDVLREAHDWLPLKTLREATPGKSHALNLALDKTNLGDIVIFSDDDVTPDEDWFYAILGVCGRWPTHSVFGGRIDPTWPGGQLPPPWAQADFIQAFAFARHVISDEECEYLGRKCPFGPNYWLRREVIGGMRFKHGLGPHPTARKLGGETEFLLRLRARGCVPVYSPSVRVQHRIEHSRLSKFAVYRRAFQLGMGRVYTEGLPEEAERGRSELRWKFNRAKRLVAKLCRLPLAAASMDENARVLRIIDELMAAGKELEALRFSEPTGAPAA